MPVDPADYPETTRGYRYPTPINAGGAEANAATDVPADLQRLAEDVDADVTAVEAAAGSASSAVASDLADHEAATTAVHGIADTSVLVTSARQVIAGTGLTGGGTLAADRTLAVAYGTSAGTAAQGNDARLSDTRTPTDNSVTSAKIVDGTIVDGDINAAAAIAKTKVAGTAITAADTGTVTDTMLAGSITPSKVTGTAVVQTVATTKGDLPVRGTSALERLPVGLAGTNPLLIPDTSASGGLKWGTWSEADVAKASQVGNLLTASQAKGISGWSTVAATVSHVGGKFRFASATDAVTSKIAYIGDYSVPAQEQEWYTLLADFAYSGAPGVQFTVGFYNASNSWIGGANYIGPVTTDATVRFAARAPAGAVSMRPHIHLPSATPSGAYVETSQVTIIRGVGGESVLPGVPVTGTIAVPLSLPPTTTLNRAQPVVVNPSSGGAKTWTLPLAADNYGVQFTLINDDTATVSLGRQAGDTVSGQAFSPTLPGKGNLVIISTGTTWLVLSGKYTTSTVGLATYEWNPTANSTTASAWWRLVAYDSGVREVLTWDASGIVTNGAWHASAAWGPRSGQAGWVRLRRTLTDVRVMADNMSPLSATISASATVCDLPEGFRPTTTGTAVTMPIFTAAATAWASAAVSNRFSVGVLSISTTGATSHYASVSAAILPASPSLPASLAGTQVTAPA